MDTKTVKSELPVKTRIKKTRFDNPLVAVVAIAAIALMEWQAIRYGIDGALLGLATAAIAGIAGYAVQPKAKEG